jgi:general secretion pathway protein L
LPHRRNDLDQPQKSNAMPSITGAAQVLVDEVTAFLEPRKGRARGRKRLILVERGDEFEIHRTNRRGTSLLTRGRLDELSSVRLPRQLSSQPIEVRLDGSRVLSKILRLPAASSGYLEPIVRHQLDRATPWSADRVVFDYAIADDEPKIEGQIAVRLVATARDVLDSVMSRLKAAGVETDLVGTTEDPIDRPSAVNLLQSEGSGPRALLRRKVVAVLVAILLIGTSLSLLTGWQLYAISATASELQAETDTVRGQIESARAGMSLSDRRQKLLAQKQDETPVVVLIDKLSQTIPASTYLTELRVENGEVHLVGLTSDAPALLELLDSSDTLSDVRFAAPTMRDEGATKDRFEIAGRFKPTVAAAAESAAPPAAEN